MSSKFFLPAAISLISLNCFSATLYDIDFESPAHTAGSTVTVGAGINTPSAITFGNPEIGSANSEMSTNHAVLDRSGATGSLNYEQFKLDLAQDSSDYWKVSFDLSTENHLGTGARFGVYFDTLGSTGLQSLGFLGDGSVQTGHISWSNTAESFSDNQLLHVEMVLDTYSQNFTWKINDNVIDSYDYTYYISGLQSIRFGLGAVSYQDRYHDSRIHLDNIFVQSASLSPVPLPGGILFFVSAIASLAIFKRKS